ncbi:TPA: prophage tail fiber N-terminal domain-containing protein [Serratia fonticola]
MAVISGVLKGPMGDALEGVVIELRALRTSATVITQERSTSVTNASGRYSLTVEPGDYSVFISAFGRTPENRGSISVKVNSATGTLNDFLLIPGESDLNPAIVATVDGMRAAAAASATAAQKSADSAATAMTNALSKVDTAEQRVVGSVLFSRPTRLTSGAADRFIPDSQGTWASWGRAAGRGSTDFVNHRGNGSGGYWFYDTDGTTITALTYINNLGDLTTIGTLTSTGDQTIKANAATPNLSLRFRDSAGVEKGSVYAQTDTGQLNIRWGGTANTASFRPDGFVALSNGLVFGNTFTTAADMPDLAGLPFIFRGPNTAGLTATPNSLNISTSFGFAVVPAGVEGLAEGVERGKPVFSVSARSGIAYVLNDIKVGATSVLKAGDYGIGGGSVSMGSTLSIDDNKLPSGNYYANASTPGSKPEGTYGHLTMVREGSTGASARQIWNANTSADLWVRIFVGTTWSAWRKLWNSLNTTVDANGFIKKASPIVKLFGDGQCELNDESQGVTTERVSEGVYRISGTLGFNADAEWGGVDGGIEIPTDRNKLPLVWVDYEVDETGDLLIKTFHRVNSTAPKFAQNVKVGYKEGQPIDIPAGRWIDLRVEMPGCDEPEYEPIPEGEEVPEVTPEVTEPEGGEEQAPGETPAPIEEHKE